MEMKIILSLVLQRVRVQMAPGATVNRNLVVTMNPKPGLPMKLHRPRDGSASQRRPNPVLGNVREMVRLPA